MLIETLIATMYRNNSLFLESMNISGKYIVVNQTDFNKYPSINLNDTSTGIFISNEERGLSKSRNLALSLSTADVCVIADDDIFYFNDYEKIIKDSYDKYPSADLIVFDFITDDKIRKCSKISSFPKKLNLLDTLKVCSVRITFKRESIIRANIKFNENFGAGAQFISGEENLFLKDCLDSNLNIMYVPKTICKVSFDDNSSWFEGYNKNYFITKGAFSYAMFKKFGILFIFQFLVRKYSLYRNQISIFKALSYSISGISKYKKNKINV